MSFLKPTIAAFLLFYSLVLSSQTSVTGELQKWHTVTITFDGPNTSENHQVNPFLDYRLNVTFSSPSGKTFLVPGFYAADGNAHETSSSSGNKWRVRFTPNETGQWTYSTSFRTGANVAISNNANVGSPTSFNGDSGNFNISASTKSLPDNRAKGRLNYVGERYLQFEETEKYFLKAGSDSPENLLAYNDFDNTVDKKTWSPHAQDWNNGDPTWKGNNGKELIGAINYLAEKGMNAFSFLTMNVIGDGKDVWPWAASSNNSLDGSSGTDAQNRKRYDVSKLAQWEILFSHADAKGMYLHFKTQETENDQLLDGGNLGNQRKLYYRELIARFGHHLALNWNLGEEHDLYQELNDSQNTRVKAYTSFIRSIDPYDHHIVIHSYPGTSTQNALYNPLLGNNSELTGPSIQSDINNVHKDVKRWILASKNSGKQWVVANDEQGGAQSGVTTDANYTGSKGSQSDNRKDTRHKVLWGTLMAGGAGVEYYFGYQTGETDLTAQDFRSRNTKWNDAKVALDFFNTNLSFWEMESHDELTSSNSDYCLAKLNDTYAIYLSNGGSTNLNLSNANGSFAVKWFNPVNGGNLVNGSVTQINGGGNRSIGNPPNNSSSDWVALIQKGETTDTISNDGCNLDLNAISDFTNINVSGFSPAYVDNDRNALAINAAQYKDKFAAAQTTFNGETGNYDITINTLTEVDGESEYKVTVDGTIIGTYQNPESAIDYVAAGTTFKNIAIEKGAEIRVEFSSHTNGKIAEGSGTAYSRGRWTSLRFECQSETTGPPTGDCDADFEEQNGLVVIEAENLSTGSGWVNSTSASGFTGNGYIDWQGADSFGNPGNGKTTAKIKINTPGTYLFQWRSKVGEGTNSTESNDSWLRFPDADDFFGQKGSSIIYPNGSGKTPIPEGSSSDGWFKVYLGGTTNWTWATSTSDNDAHKIYVKFNNAGTFTIELSGRSKHHLIDRIVLSKDVNNATNLDLAETLCTGESTTISATSVSITPKTASVEEGNTLALSAEVLPSNATNKRLTWSSSDTTIASVNENGFVTTLKKGSVTITATSEDGSFEDSSTISIIEKVAENIPVTRIYVTPQRVTLAGGETTELSYQLSPSNASNKNVVWSSSDETVAMVDQNGFVTGLKEGTVEIEVRTEEGAYRSDSRVTVTSNLVEFISIEGIAITPESALLKEGETLVLSYEISPVDATNKNVLWSSSDETIATVSEDGTVSAIKEGDVSIAVTSEDGEIRGETSISVITITNKKIVVTGIEVSPKSAFIKEGQTLGLTFSITPVDAENRNVKWYSSDETIAIIDENGSVTALKKGIVTITGETEDGGFESTAIINITEAIPVTRIYVTPQRVTIEEGGTTKLRYLISPSNATNKNVIWSSEDETIATVDAYGRITALKVGTVEIEARTIDGGFRSDSSVKVIPNLSVTGIAVNPESASVEEGSTLSLGFQITPTNASNTNVNWSSSDDTVATVSQNGLITAISEGVVFITVTSVDGDFASSSTITVNPKNNDEPSISIRGVYVTSQRVTLEVDKTFKISYYSYPSNATNKNIIWSSTNKSIATVDENGLVTAHKVGGAKIQAVTEDGGFLSDATLTVVPSANSAKQAVIVYPNPTSDEVRINSTEAKGGWVGLYSMNGTLLQQKEIQKNQDTVLSLAEYHTGTYMIKVFDLKNTTTKTVVKL